MGNQFLKYYGVKLVTLCYHYKLALCTNFVCTPTIINWVKITVISKPRGGRSWGQEALAPNNFVRGVCPPKLLLQHWFFSIDNYNILLSRTKNKIWHILLFIFITQHFLTLLVTNVYQLANGALNEIIRACMSLGFNIFIVTIMAQIGVGKVQLLKIL